MSSRRRGYRRDYEFSKLPEQCTPEDVYNYASDGNRKGLLYALMKDSNRTDLYYNQSGFTACHIAVWNNIAHSIFILLSKGFDINCKSLFGGMTAFELAIDLGREKIVEIFLENDADLINSRDEDGNTVMHLVAGSLFAKNEGRGHEKIMDMLLERKIDINSMNHDCKTAIDLAAELDNTNIVMKLLDCNIDINRMNSDGKTLYHEYAINGDYEVFEKILEKNTDINIKTSDGKTSLHLAAFHSNEGIVELLLEKGIEIDDDIDLYTPCEEDDDDNDDKDCRPLIFEELQNRRKRAIFDSFISYHIEYKPYINSIYSRCYPTGSLHVAMPPIGWIAAEAIRDKFYFDEVFFYMFIHVASVNTQPGTILTTSSLDFHSNKTYTLMTILTDRLKMFLKSDQNLGKKVDSM